MKIGILVTIICGFGKKGFYHSQEVGLGKALNELGHSVIVYKGVEKGKSMDPMKVSDSLEVRYIPISALGVHGYFPSDQLDPTLDGLLVFADTQIFLPHIYHWCEKNGVCFVPYIGIAHSAEKNAKSILMDMLYRAGTQRIYKKIPVLVKTDAVREEMNDQGVKNCVVTPVGLDETELKTDYREQDRSALRRAYGYTDEDVIISFVGRLKSEKRPLDMIDIFDHVKDKKQFKLLIVGEGYLYDDIRAKVKEKGLDRRVQMIQRVPYEKMWEIHYIADYFVNLCDREIFGMALLEGIYYGSAAAAANAPGPAFILRDLPGHALCQSDQEIERFLTAAPPSRQALEESVKILMRRISWEPCARAIVEQVEAYRQKKSAAVKGGGVNA